MVHKAPQELTFKNLSDPFPGTIAITHSILDPSLWLKYAMYASILGPLH